MNGLVMYLPHAYEGQGPEHSSARIERFLQLCAKNNMILANCSTPANFFHLLRRHMKMPFRNPLIVFTPKSLLRHPRCVSPVDHFSKGHFYPLIDDDAVKASSIKKVLFCSGKLYYDLLEKREEEKHTDTAIIRIEQLYPLPEQGLSEAREKYINAEKFVWVQEEPANSGMMPFLKQNFTLFDLDFISREASASPATGFYKQHAVEQEEILKEAFNG
jgi:2-oxoglutarate dehydrogenase E1 component